MCLSRVDMMQNSAGSSGPSDKFKVLLVPLCPRTGFHQGRGHRPALAWAFVDGPRSNLKHK